MGLTTLFKKKSKNVIPFEDDNFLMIEWDKKSGNLKNSVIQEIIEEIDNELEDEEQIKNTLPYLTFLQAEELFSKIYSKLIQSGEREEFLFKRVQVIHYEDEEISSEGELEVSPFIIDSEYQSILKILIETIFNKSEYDDFSYDQKRSYFYDNLYQTYLTSLDIHEDYLPIFPSEEEAEGGNVIVEFPLGNEEKEEKIEPVAKSIFHEEKVEPKVIPKPITSIADSSFGNTAKNEDSIAFLFDDNKKDSAIQNSSSNQTKKTNYVPINNMENTISVFPNFPKFEVQQELINLTVPTYHDEYVEIILNKKKNEFNNELERYEKENQDSAKQTIEKIITQKEKEDTSHNLEEINKQDIRPTLKEKVITEIKELRTNELEEAARNLDSERQSKIDEENKRHEAILLKIDNEYKTSQIESQKKISDKYLVQAQNEYESKFYEESARLQEMFEEMQANCFKDRAIYSKQLSKEYSEKGKEIANELFDHFEKILKEIKKNEEIKHEKGLKINLIERAEKLEKERSFKENEKLEEAIKAINKVKQELKDTKQDNDRLVKESFEQQRNALVSQANVLNAITEKAVSEPVNDIETIKKLSANNSITLKQKGLKKILGVFAGILLVGSIGGLSILEANNQKIIEANNTIVHKKLDEINNSVELQKTVQEETSNSSQKQFDSILSTQKQNGEKASALEKKQEEFSETVSNLQSKFDEQKNTTNPIVVEINGIPQLQSNNNYGN